MSALPVRLEPDATATILHSLQHLEREVGDVRSELVTIGLQLDNLAAAVGALARVAPLLDEFAPVLEQVRARMSKGSWRTRFGGADGD